MNNIKKVLIGILAILGLAVIILLLDYVRINIRYFLSKKDYEESIVINGVTNGYTPQGLAYIEENNIVLETAYKKNSVSKLFVIDLETGKLLYEYDLLRSNGKENTNHVGGIATDGDNIWITSDYEVNIYKLSDILDTTSSNIKSKQDSKIPIRGDFCYYKNKVLWIGDFFLKPFYNVPDDNPLLLYYEVNNSLDYDKPKLAISLPKMVQGMSIDEDNNFYFTASFTNLINSTLYKYKDVTDERSLKIKINNKYIPYYKFTNESLLSTKKLPPMAEGMFYKDGYLYILFESNANKYFFADPKIKNVIKYKVK